MSDDTKALVDALLESELTLDKEINNLIRRHGRVAVRDATKRLTAGKPGRPKINDMPAFKAAFEQDARDWLDGRNPNKRVSSRALAKQFAKNNPGHDELATFERVYEKLREVRRRQFLAFAYSISEKEHSIDRHLSVVRAINTEWEHWVWRGVADLLVLKVEKFKDHGGIFGPETTWQELEAASFAATQTIGSPSADLRLLSVGHSEIETNKPTTEIGD